MNPVQAALQSVVALLTERPEAIAEIFAASSDALVAFDADRCILHANRAAEALFGYDAGALRGASTDTLIPERFRQRHASPMVPVADVMQIELPGLRRDGTELAIEWAFVSVPLEGERAISVMTVRDRALADRAIEALRASEERFRLLIEGADGYAIFMLDAAGNVSSWNKGAERINGWSRGEIIGRPYEVFFSADDRAAGLPRQLLAAAIRDGKHEVDGWRVRKDGSLFRAGATITALRSPDGALRGFAKITRDLTEREKAAELERRLGEERAGRVAAEAAEQRVRASEERLRRLQRVTAALSEAATQLEVRAVVLHQTLETLDASAGGIYVLAADGKSLELIDHAGHLASTVDQFSTFPLDLRTPISDAARTRTASFYESSEACAEAYPNLREVIHAGGAEASAALPLLARGTLLGVLGIRFRERRVFDEADRAMLLTLSELCAQALERARLLVAESDARADAEAANRSKDEFLAMLGHELRNPLAPIVTALSLMQLRDNDASNKERSAIERHVTHLVRLVDDLLDVSRITGGKVELKKARIELAAVIARGIELSSPLLESRNQHLTLLVPAEGFAVHADPTRLAQVVANLVTNSAKYTPAGGHIEIGAVRNGDRIVLSVRDDGIGIAPAMLPRVFDLFAQERQDIDRSQGGLGLGLAIVKSIVAMHEGTVWVTSEGRGKGSVFSVELPIAASRVPSQPVPGSKPPAAKVGRRVLVVDDNVDASDLLAELLRAKGHITATALDGPSALLVADAFHPEVALLDIGLPVMDGYELARRLRSKLGSVRLIAVTGYGQDADRARTKAAGFDAHMTKPVELDALEAALVDP